MSLTNATLEAMAMAMLPKMDDREMWDAPPRACTADAHQWELVHDWTVTQPFGPATITSTFAVAIVCSNCEIGFGFG